MVSHLKDENDPIYLKFIRVVVLLTRFRSHFHAAIRIAIKNR